MALALADFAKVDKNLIGYEATARKRRDIIYGWIPQYDYESF
jgi:hypothetical protein